MLIVRELYGLEYSSASSGVMLADTIGKDCLGYTSTDIDKDFWIKREVLPDEKEYY